MISGGTRLGPYEIKDFLGAGGMGEVYRATDTRLDRIVALKLLPMELAGDPDRLRRFEHEARAASVLNHPAIVTIYDAGQLGSQPYISMELVAGRTLREILAIGALSVRRALQIGAQIADGLAKAHQAGIVHRDLKPENVKVANEGSAKILDFGLAKHMSDAGPLLKGDARTAMETRPGTVIGTVGYMSPEQARGVPVDFQSDQFSFGAILYEMLTGRRAFDRPTAAETLSAIIREHPSSIATLNAAVPPPVRWIVERCLSKDPGDRYMATRDLARDLASAREHLAELLAAGRGRSTRRTAGEAALLVLPLVNLSGDPKQEYLADGMTELLITELSQRGGLRVISQTSSMSYKAQRRTLPEIAEETGVEWVVRGSFARAGGQVRITAQLVDATTDENRWAHTYDRSVRDIFGLQSEVASTIARDVKAAMLPARPNGTTLAKTPDLLESKSGPIAAEKPPRGRQAVRSASRRRPPVAPASRSRRKASRGS